MKYKNNFMIMLFALCCILVSSCDVHEFPDPKPKEIPFVLHLEYDTEMPLYKIVEMGEGGLAKSSSSGYDIRYIVNVYDGEDDASREELYSFVFTKDGVSELDNSVTLVLPEGNYRFVVWTDYVHRGLEQDFHYVTERFEYVTLPESDHCGSTDLRDAFSGSVTAEVSEESTEAEVAMSRPMAKFNFISTDVRNFMAQMAGKNGLQPQSLSDFSGYTVVFIYNGFMPSAYNLHTGKPADSRVGVRFSSAIRQLNEDEAEMGFDYLFVNGSESRVSVSIEVYDADGTLLSRFQPIEVPLMRSKLTTIKANFLTSDADGGVSVDPGYDGEFILPVN